MEFKSNTIFRKNKINFQLLSIFEIDFIFTKYCIAFELHKLLDSIIKYCQIIYWKSHNLKSLDHCFLDESVKTFKMKWNFFVRKQKFILRIFWPDKKFTDFFGIFLVRLNTVKISFRASKQFSIFWNSRNFDLKL